MEGTDLLLSATNVHRDFRTTDGVLEVLKGITLEIKKGEMVAVTGASGVGKSTLLHILGGLDRPTRGDVAVNTTPYSHMTETGLSQFRNRNIGFVFQFHYLLEDFTAAENVMIPMLLGGRKQGDARQRAELLLSEVGLTSRKSHRPRQLSGGEQQRVAVARALANDPGIVLADEPSGNLDSSTGRMLHELLFRLNSEKSITFLIATHNRELAERCDRELKMFDGQVRE
jgi:lipoprotein-releasing system ATP-binding protein